MKEKDYTTALQAMGIYDPAFDAAIHQLCILERELSRAMKQWKATAAPGQAPLVTSPIYQIICQLRRDIRASRDELGLTPKALKRLRGQAGANSGTDVPGAGSGSLADIRHIQCKSDQLP